MTLHEIERNRQEAREKVKLEYVKSLGFESIDRFNELQKTDLKLWLNFWTEIHNRLEALGLSTSITRRCNYRGLLEGETEQIHLNSHEYCRIYKQEPRRIVALTVDTRPREWFCVENEESKK